MLGTVGMEGGADRALGVFQVLVLVRDYSYIRLTYVLYVVVRA